MGCSTRRRSPFSTPTILRNVLTLTFQSYIKAKAHWWRTNVFWIYELLNQNGRRCREAADGLWFPRTDNFLACGRDDDGRTHRERVEGRTGSILRCDDRDSCRDS